MFYDLKNSDGIYKISNLGRIRNMEKVNMKFFDSVDRYKHVTLFKSGKQSNYCVHLLVAKQFLIKGQGQVQVDNISRLRSDNRLSYLRYVTLQQQMTKEYSIIETELHITTIAKCYSKI